LAKKAPLAVGLDAGSGWVRVVALGIEDNQLYYRGHSRVPANAGVVVLGCLPVITQHPEAIAQGRIVGDHRPGFAPGAQVFAGIKAEAGHHAERADDLAAVLRPVRLGGVFHQREIVFAANRQNRVHVERVAVEMDRHDRFGARRDGALDQLRVQVERCVIGIHKDRPGAHVGNGPARRDERAGGGDDLIPGTDIEQPHRYMQRRRAAVEGDAVLRPAEPGEVLLKLHYVRPKAERAVVERARNRGVNVLAYPPHLGRQVQIWHRCK